MDPLGLTIITPVKPDQVESLRTLLHSIGDDVQGNALVPFLRLKSIHFARIVILDARHDAYGREIPPSLMLATDFDPPVEAHLDELIREAGPGLDSIYAHCIGYSSGTQSLRSYLLDHVVGNAAFYAGAGQRSMPQINEEASLRDAIERFLDREAPASGWERQSPQDIRRAIQAFVRNEPALAWAQAPAPARSLGWRVRYYGWLAGFIAAVGATWLGLPVFIGSKLRRKGRLGLLGSLILTLKLIAAPIVIFFGLVRLHELREAQRDTEDDFKYIRTVMDREDLVGQNAMTWLINLKPGWFRLFTIRFVMFGTSLGIRYVFTRGTLIGIPSVHFARWSIIDNNRRLLFLSNFDGSWENYTSDFVDRAAWGLTAIWSNTVGFSDTRWLFFGGARSERHFKGTHRDNEPPTDVFYSAHRHVSLQNIYQNTKVRAGLWGEMDDVEAREWLSLL